MPHAGAFLGNEGHNEADEAECLGEGGRQDEDRERAALNLGLTRHGARGAERRKADGKAGTDNTETVSDNSHNSSFVMRRYGAGLQPMDGAALAARVTS